MLHQCVAESAGQTVFPGMLLQDQAYVQRMGASLTLRGLQRRGPRQNVLQYLCGIRLTKEEDFWMMSQPKSASGTILLKREEEQGTQLAF